MNYSSKNPWTVQTKFKGSLTAKTEGVVMNNSRDRIAPNKTVVTYFITENLQLFEGQNTVALFKLKKEASLMDETIILSDLSVNGCFRANVFGHKLMKTEIKEGEKIGVRNPLGQLIFYPEDQIVYVVKSETPVESKKESLNSTGLFTKYLSDVNRDKKQNAAIQSSSI